MHIDLQGKQAFVCGSTQGIGRATAHILANAGANITLIARNETKLQAVLADLPTTNNQTHDYIVADFQRPSELKERVEAWLTNGKAVHILINNTGGPKGGPIAQADISEFVNAYHQHLVCNHILVQALLEGMKAESYGRIINIISTSVKQPIPGLGVSNTTRGAVASWAKTLANELGQYGITVNNVLPGFTSTGRLASIINARATRFKTSDANIEQGMKASVPAGRFATAEEIAYSVAFLASPFASYINGINLPVDGGRTKCL